MGFVTVLTGLLMIVLGVGSLAMRRPLLPEILPDEVAMATIPFGVMIALIGLILF